jgi:hypothetical protein
LADLISNTSSITAYDPSFSKVYMAEKKLLLDVLHDGDQALLKRCRDIVNKYFDEAEAINAAKQPSTSG